MKDRTYLPLTTKQGNDATVVLMLSQKNAQDARQPFPDSGKTWEFFLKDRADDEDPEPLAGSRAESMDTLDEVAVVTLIPASLTSKPGTFFYRLDAVSSASGRETVSWGSFSVIDV